jgi:hypothetical protein
MLVRPCALAQPKAFLGHSGIRLRAHLVVGMPQCVVLVQPINNGDIFGNWMGHACWRAAADLVL